MSKICQKCGASVADNEAFCPNCGAMINDNQQYYQQTNYNQPPYAQSMTFHTSIGGWLGWIFLCSFLGIIGTIITICCAKDVSVKNWGKANLILQIIVIVLTILLISIVGVSLFSFLPEISSSVIL